MGRAVKKEEGGAEPLPLGRTVIYSDTVLLYVPGPISVVHFEGQEQLVC